MSYEDCACVGGCENCEQLDYAAIVWDAKRFERERIIKILEAEGSSTFSLAYIISLIKGENK